LRTFFFICEDFFNFLLKRGDNLFQQEKDISIFSLEVI